MSGSPNRVEKFIRFINDKLKYVKDEEIKDLCTTDRYVMFKAGPFLAANVSMSYVIYVH